MANQYPKELTTIGIDAGAVAGPLERWRQSLGHGGINPLPLPEHVVSGVSELRPRLIRIFIQEFFRLLPAPGQYNWSLLDPYLDSFARTGAQVCAAICIKPPCLYPQKDPAIWQPNDLKAWQDLIAAMVRRYSVERPIVTHWEIGNETDIGEDGGCPYLIKSPADYAEYYRFTIEPILRLFPQAKLGGPAVAWDVHGLLAPFAKICRDTNLPLHFVSWHRYDSDASSHARIIREMSAMASALPGGGGRPELFITEWNRQLTDEPMVEDQACDSIRTADAASILLQMLDAGVDYTFYYHIWDQVCRGDDFAPFFTDRGVKLMLRHWNEIPHRLGLFSVDGRVRPQYFLYWMLAQMGEQRLSHSGGEPLGILASRHDIGTRILAVNSSRQGAGDRAISWQFSNLPVGPKMLRAYRVDRSTRSATDLALTPLESRAVWTGTDYECRTLLPSDTVGLLCLDRA